MLRLRLVVLSQRTLDSVDWLEQRVAALSQLLSVQGAAAPCITKTGDQHSSKKLASGAPRVKPPPGKGLVAVMQQGHLNKKA